MREEKKGASLQEKEGGKDVFPSSEELKKRWMPIRDGCRAAYICGGRKKGRRKRLGAEGGMGRISHQRLWNDIAECCQSKRGGNPKRRFSIKAPTPGN